MGKLRMHINELGKMDELERGEGKYGFGIEKDGATNVENRPMRGWRDEGLVLYYKIMVTSSAILVLLWQFGAFTSARPAIQKPRQVAGVPQYVLDYAPLIWLDTQEKYFPSDMSTQVSNTRPFFNQSILSNAPAPLSLQNLDSLNAYGNGGLDIYLTSTTDVRESPSYLLGVIPSTTTHKTNSAVSCAIIVTDKGNGSVDAFYMYFYAFNMGNVVLWHELGDHIGDWEHNMIRFKDGAPKEMWYSQHGNGQAFKFPVVEKIGNRPVSYSARGSHANYAIAGTHDHTIPDVNTPIGFLLDYTSKGTLWDPTLSAYFYNYNIKGKDPVFESIGGSPVGAMNYKGKWGDEQYPDNDPRQPPKFFGFAKYVGGPTGPGDKQLNRTKTCPDNGILCIIRTVLSP